MASAFAHEMHAGDRNILIVRTVYTCKQKPDAEEAHHENIDTKIHGLEHRHITDRGQRSGRGGAFPGLQERSSRQDRKSVV